MLGDDFGFNSFNKYYYEQDKTDCYMIEMFEVSGFNNDKKASYDNNVLSRMRNCLVGTVRDQVILPKFITVVLDADLINYCKNKLHGGIDSVAASIDYEAMYERLLRWLMNQNSRIIMSQKEHLPKKAKRQDDPIFLWIEPLTHNHFRNNYYREKFAKAVNKAVNLVDRNYSLQLIKCWDHSDSSLVDRESRKYTAGGYIT